MSSFHHRTIHPIAPQQWINTAPGGIGIVFVAEGFTRDQESQFWNLCIDGLRSFFKHSPFNQLQALSSIFQVHGFFKPALASGIRDQNNTIFGTKVASLDQKLTCDANLIAEFIEDAKLYTAEETVPLADLPLFTGEIGLKHFFVVVLVNDTELAHPISQGLTEDGIKYTLIAPRLHWYQYLQRLLGMALGLGLEDVKVLSDYPLPEFDHLYESYFDNLLVISNPGDNIPAEAISKWQNRLASHQLAATYDIVPGGISSASSGQRYSVDEVQFIDKGNKDDYHLIVSTEHCLSGLDLVEDVPQILTSELSLCRLCGHYLLDTFHQLTIDSSLNL